ESYSGTHLTLLMKRESGESSVHSIEIRALNRLRQENIGGDMFVELSLPCPMMPQGYHSLKVSITGLDPAECTLIVTPDRAWLPENLDKGGRMAGVAISL